MSKQAGKVSDERCAYCGADANLNRDHVPPKGIFPKPRPDNLITVPACPKCHDKQTSKDDEYFRLALNVRDELSHHPDVQKNQLTIMRRFEDPNKVRMFGAFLKSLRLIEQNTPGGIFIKHQLAIQTDMNRVRRVVKRTMKGLFYHHKGHKIPDGYDALICDEESFQNWPANVKDAFNESMIKPILASKAITIGNDVFSYRFGFDRLNPNTTCWIFVFYGRASFMGLTLPSD